MEARHNPAPYSRYDDRYDPRQDSPHNLDGNCSPLTRLLWVLTGVLMVIALVRYRRRTR